MMDGRNVLLIEDEPADAALVRRSFRGHEDEIALEHVTTLQAGIERLAAGDVDAVLLDLRLPDSQGIDTVARIRASDPEIPIVVCTAAGDEETAVAALAAGAQDYLVKDEIGCSLLRSIRHAIERSRIAREGALLERRLRRLERMESLGTLYAGIGWAFNTLIGTIFDRCDHALASLSQSGHETQVRTALLEIHRAASRQAEMIQRLRDYAAIERSAGGEVDLAAFVLEASDFLTTIVPPRVEISWEAVGGGPLIVGVTRPELHRLLVSLIVNAAEAIGGRPGFIAISTGTLEADAALLAETHGWPDPKPGTYVYLRVADTGRGLGAAGCEERIFDPFFTTKLAGRGLGLTGVAGVLRRRRAVIYVAGNHPAGTVFTILFPRVG